MPEGAVRRPGDESPAEPVKQDENDESRPIGGLVSSGLRWSLVNNAIGRAGTLVAGIVLARILAPEDYGVFAVALVVLSALLSMNELGVSLAIVRWPGDVRRIAPTVATIAVTSSAVLYLACFVLAPYVAGFMNAPEATGVLRLLCLGVLADAVSAVPSGVLTREFRQRERLYADMCGLTVSIALSVALATAGYGAWSLAWGAVVGNVVVSAVVLRFASQHMRFGFDRGEARSLLHFGLPLAGSSLLLFAMLNSAYVVIGGMLSPTQLGFYLLAFNLASWPVNMLSTAVRRVALAGFSRLQHDARALREGFARSLGLLCTATVPICLLLGMLAEPLIRSVYGDQWAPAAPALEMLAVVAAVRVLLELAYDFLVGLGRSGTILRLQAIWLVCVVPAMVLGCTLDGIAGASLAQAAVAVLVVTPAFVVVLHRLGVPATLLARACIRPAVGGLVAAAATGLALAGTHGSWWELLVGGLAGAIAYAAIVGPGLRREFRRAEATSPAPRSGVVSA